MSLLLKSNVACDASVGYYSESGVQLWVGVFESFLKSHIKQFTSKEKAMSSGEKIIKNVEENLGNERGAEALKKTGWTIKKMRDKLKNEVAKI